MKIEISSAELGMIRLALLAHEEAKIAQTGSIWVYGPDRRAVHVATLRTEIADVSALRTRLHDASRADAPVPAQEPHCWNCNAAPCGCGVHAEWSHFAASRD